MTDHRKNAWAHACHRIPHYLIAAAVFAVAACTAAPVDKPSPGDSATGQTSQALDGPLKMCDVFVPNSWSDTFDVVDGGPISECAQAARNENANDYQLGCQFDDGSTSWGNPLDNPFGVTLPSPNCGWACVSNTGHHCSTSLTCHCARTTIQYPGIVDCAGDCVFDPDVEGCADACRRAGGGGITP